MTLAMIFLTYLPTVVHLPLSPGDLTTLNNHLFLEELLPCKLISKEPLLYLHCMVEEWLHRPLLLVRPHKEYSEPLLHHHMARQHPLALVLTPHLALRHHLCSEDLHQQLLGSLELINHCRLLQPSLFQDLDPIVPLRSELVALPLRLHFRVLFRRHRLLELLVTRQLLHLRLAEDLDSELLLPRRSQQHRRSAEVVVSEHLIIANSANSFCRGSVATEAIASTLMIHLWLVVELIHLTPILSLAVPGGNDFLILSSESFCEQCLFLCDSWPHQKVVPYDLYRFAE